MNRDNHSSKFQDFEKETNFAIGGAAEHHRRLLFLFCRLRPTGECPDDSVTLRIQEITIGAVCGKHRARSLKGGTQELGQS